MSNHAIIDALKAVCADLEAIAPNTPSLHFAKGLLAAGVAMPVQNDLVGRAGLPAQEIIEKYRSGLGGPELAKEYGVSSETIYRLLLRFGINGKGMPRGPKGKWQSIAPRAAELYRNGLSLGDIAAELEASVPSVRKALVFANVQIRPAGQARLEGVDSRFEQIMVMRKDGATFEEIGAFFQITRERVRQIIKAAGHWDEAQERPLRPEEIAAAKEYEAGATIEYIAAKLGIGLNGAKAVVAKAGVVLRPRQRQTSQVVQDRANKAAELYSAGKRIVDIADAIGLKNPEQVYRLLSIKGIKPSRLARRVVH